MNFKTLRVLLSKIKFILYSNFRLSYPSSSHIISIVDSQTLQNVSQSTITLFVITLFYRRSHANLLLQFMLLLSKWVSEFLLPLGIYRQVLKVLGNKFLSVQYKAAFQLHLFHSHVNMLSGLAFLFKTFLTFLMTYGNNIAYVISLLFASTEFSLVCKFLFKQYARHSLLLLNCCYYLMKYIVDSFNFLSPVCIISCCNLHSAVSCSCYCNLVYMNQ